MGSTGIQRGQTSCTATFNVTSADEDATTDPEETNPVNNIVDELEDLTGVTGSQFWLIFMVAVAGVTLTGFALKHSQGQHINGAIMVTLILVEQVGLLIVGNLFGFISTALIIIVAVLSTVILGLWFGIVVAGDRIR